MGTSNVSKVNKNVLKDHPHAYGDKLSFSPVRYGRGSSSPRIWGQVILLDKIAAYDGIIPTRMGTSRYAKRIEVHSRDHPHACGDKIMAV